MPSRQHARSAGPEPPRLEGEARRLETTYTSLVWALDGSLVTKIRKPSHDARARFRYEHKIGRLLRSDRPPVPTPRLISSNVQSRSLTFEAVACEPLGPKYPDSRVDVGALVDIARRLRPFNPKRRWLRQLDPLKRLTLAVRMNVLDVDVANELAPAMKKLRSRLRFAHGDLTARNVLRDESGTAVLIDWEWAGLYPRNYDEGFLWFTLLEAPERRAEIEASVDDPLPMLMSALIVQLWHLQWYVSDEHKEAQQENRDEILSRIKEHPAKRR